MAESKRKKLGLALSGGGFRASLFHIGVLAKLAENNILKNVEVISCVSGGSIIGAYYYLFLKELLQTNADNRIKHEDYIEIIKKIEIEFFEKVQTNIRVQAFSSLRSNSKMIIGNKYSRSDRMADLYDQHFYNRFRFDNDKNNDRKLSLRELIINPFEDPIKEDIRKYNLKRKNKVPMLILNATTLNSGRNWQFTAEDMGEWESKVREEEGNNIESNPYVVGELKSKPKKDDKENNKLNPYNKNVLFKAFEFTEEVLKGESKKYIEFPLGTAVAASACVPALFTPLALTELYDEITPLLVDGGVYDNQGISPIIYEGCSHVIVSDASGQLDFMNNLRNDPVGVTKRTNSILMNRIRNQGFEFVDLIQKSKEEKIDNKILLHLREGLERPTIIPKSGMIKMDRNEVTDYKINKEVQRLLSSLRTDLDSFTEVEAFSLMYSGYCMTGNCLTTAFLPEPNAYLPTEWNFKKVKEYCEIYNEDFCRQLKIGKSIFFKSRRTSWIHFFLELLAFFILVVILAIPFILILLYLPEIYFVIYLCLTLLLVISNLVKFVNVVKKNIFFKTLSIIHTSFIVVSGYIVSNLYLIWVNNKFNKWGSIESLIKKSKKEKT
ncbi:MAG: patatin-like phospholipase family protein [Bacteroidota bacterium]|nr:patatin-like phospholipase family protein [Bacteroidota bacterium]